MQPDVTVLIPVYNGGRFLAAAVQSVLAQTVSVFELIVVDDASTDDSVAVVSRMVDRRIKLIRNPGNLGLARTLNVGLSHATGRFVARLDQDDVAHPDRLAVQLQYFTDHPGVTLLGSQARLVDEDDRERGRVERPVSPLGIRWLLLLENPFIHSSVMFRREVALSLGGYDETLTLSEDIDFWGRFVQAGEVANLPSSLIDYRQWSASMMSSVEQDPRGVRQAELRRTMAGLIRRHVANELGGDPLSDADAHLLAGFTVGVDAGQLDDFLKLYSEVRRRFEARHAGARESDDYWRTVASQYDAIAFRLTPSSRAASASIYAHALRAEPGLARYLSWPRAAASVMLGKEGRGRLARAVTRTRP